MPFGEAGVVGCCEGEYCKLGGKDKLGRRDGVDDGCKLGGKDKVGRGDGLDDGAIDGENDGDDIGEDDGLLDGCVVGRGDGSCEGAAVGVEVGFALITEYNGINLPDAALGERMTWPISIRRAEDGLMLIEPIECSIMDEGRFILDAEQFLRERTRQRLDGAPVNT